MTEQSGEKDVTTGVACCEKIARAGDTFPCGIQTPHEDHLHRPEGHSNAYRCDGDTDTRADRFGHRPQAKENQGLAALTDALPGEVRDA